MFQTQTVPVLMNCKSHRIFETTSQLTPRNWFILLRTALYELDSGKRLIPVYLLGILLDTTITFGSMSIRIFKGCHNTA